jgi:hypothetical protein
MRSVPTPARRNLAGVRLQSSAPRKLPDNPAIGSKRMIRNTRLSFRAVISVQDPM